MEPTLDQFASMVAECGLISNEELQAFASSLPQKDRPETALQLAGALVRAHKLNEYQAAQLCQGDSKKLLFGEYIVLGKIGEGGMGVVFKARHRRMDRFAAIKVLHEDEVRNPESINRFYLEVRTIARLSHPNIVAAYDASEQQGAHYLVMEYVDGKSLAAVAARSGPMPWPLALACIVQSAQGLECAHNQGVIHRDIKPGNLLLEKNGVVKVLDLGLARLRSGGAVAVGPSGETMPQTQKGEMMGTIDYMSPEQANDSRMVDHRTDVYSLGCTFFHLLVGHPPYPDGSLVDRVLAHRQSDIPSLTEQMPDSAPVMLDAILRKMLAKKPQNRYSGMQELITDLRECRKFIPPESQYEIQGDPLGRTDLAVFYNQQMFLDTSHEEPGKAQSLGGGSTHIVTPAKHAPTVMDKNAQAPRRGWLWLVVLLLLLAVGAAGWRFRDHWLAQKPDPAKPADPLENIPEDDSHLSAAELQAKWVKKLYLDGPTMENSLEMQFSLIPPGSFETGLTDQQVREMQAAGKKEGIPTWYLDGLDAESPRHKVTITRPYWIGTYEVTQKQYEDLTGETPSSYFMPDIEDRLPVETVTWGQAAEFCQRLSGLEEEKAARRRYRLPTEAEWEWACRAKTNTAYHYGDDLTVKQANFNDEGFDTFLGEPKPVGDYSPNTFGLYDMHGNVWEWCQDSHEEYSANAVTDPLRVEEDSPDRIIRGGGWGYGDWQCRSRHRGVWKKEDRNQTIGFRVVCEVDMPE